MLYIGQAGRSGFGVRLRQHNWELWTPTPVHIYLGRLYADPQNLPSVWHDGVPVNSQTILDRVEKLLIFAHSPPFNAASINKVCLPNLLGSIDNDFRIFNWGMRKSLQAEISLWRWENSRTVGHRLPGTVAPIARP